MSRSLQVILSNINSYGDRPAIMAFKESGVRTSTFAELADRVVCVANGLLAEGVDRGEPIAVLAPNSPEWIIVALATVATGAVVVPLDIRLGMQTLAHEVADCGCRRVFATRGTLESLRAATPKGRRLEVFLLDVARDCEDGRSWTSLCRESEEKLPEIEPNDTAALFYTSGTTGLPKGVPLSHANLLSNIEALRKARLSAPGVRALLPLPLHHVYPFMVGMLVPLDGGATIVFPAGIIGPDIVQALCQSRAQVLIGVPRLYEALVAAIRRRMASRAGSFAYLALGIVSLSVWLRRRFGWRVGRVLLWPLHRRLAPGLKMVASGGAALDEDVGWMLEGLGWEVLTGYGLTETSPIITFTARGHGRIGTVGRPLPGVELRCVPVSGMEGGELQVRGPNVFSGYRNRPEADRKAFTEDGWFRTGDLGKQDTDGNLKILSRLGETIVLPDGKNVYPEEVEEIYLKSELISEIAVLERGGALVALVVPDVASIRRAGCDDPGKAVRDDVRRLAHEMPSHQRVTDQRITYDALPRTTLGKLRRHLLQGCFEAAAPDKIAASAEGPPLSVADRELLSAPLARQIMEWLRQSYPDRQVTLDADPQTDLGVDSLSWVSLTLELEEVHGIRLGQAAVARITSVRDLIREALEARDRSFDVSGRLLAEEARWLAPVGVFLRALGSMCLFLNRVIFKIFFHLEVKGLENLPKRGPVVVTPNHMSFLDPFALAAALPKDFAQQTYWAGIRSYLFSSRARRLFSRMAHVIPIDQDRAASTGILLANEILKRGLTVVWFPEGQRSHDGRLQDFMPGIGRLADHPETSFLPVAIRGTFEAWPRAKRFPRPYPVSISFGVPVGRRALAEAGEGASENERISNGLRRRLAILAGQ
jgi:long-chain acyl-CoA synthetase